MIMQGGGDLGAALYKTWTKSQRRQEITRLVEGYRNGLPVGILCHMTTLIAGSKKQARKLLLELLTPEERQTAVAAAEGGMRPLLEEYLA